MTVASPPGDASDVAPFYVRRRFWILIVITVVGAAFRFACLDRPPLYGDEALTYSRVIGSLDEMFSILRFDGFTPLNYELYYWLHKGMPIGPVTLAPGLILTPRVMRIIPALCGTLLIPAMYFAARQFGSVRSSLLAAAIGCFSAYTMAYSHDAKMYVQTWLFVALNIGCFFCWMRGRRLTPWLCWVVTGLAATGFHITAALVLAPQLLLVFVLGWQRWRIALLTLAGLVLVALGPIGYYGFFNQWSQRTGGILPAASDTTLHGQWDASGLTWVEDRNRNATGPQLLRETASAYLVGTEWPTPSRRQLPIDPTIDALVGYAFVSCAVLVALGALPWRRKDPFDAAPEPGSRVLLRLALLLVVPVYGFFYCRSVRGFASPITWNVVPAILLVVSLASRQRRAQLVRFGVVSLAVILVCSMCYVFWRVQYTQHWAKMRELYGAQVDPQTQPELDWKSLWMPRYMGVVWPAFAIGISLLIMRLPTKWIRWPAIAWLLAINALNGAARMVAGTQPPQERILADIRDARDGNGSTRIVMTMLDPIHRGVARWFRASNYGLYGHAGIYYACMTLGYHDVTPTEFRTTEVVNRYYSIAREFLPPQQVRAMAESNPDTARLIVWERHERWGDPHNLPDDDAVTQSLGTRWELARPAEVFMLRSWYEWGDMGWMRRREFVRMR